MELDAESLERGDRKVWINTSIFNIKKIINKNNICTLIYKLSNILVSLKG